MSLRKPIRKLSRFPQIRNMKILIFLFSILAALPAVAAEVWWLEMDKTFHDALIKRFTEGDPAACRQIGDKLPELIKQGKIKELEWVTSESKTGGRNFPAGEAEIKLPGGRKSNIKTGSLLQHRPIATKPDIFRFQITTPANGVSATLQVVTVGKFSKQWQPLFAHQSKGRTRILLGRDPAANEDFWKTKGLLSASAAVPEATKLTWFLCEGHPLIAASTEPHKREAARFREVASFREGPERFVGPSEDLLRGFGINFVFELDPEKGCVVKLMSVQEENGKSSIGKAFTAKGSEKLLPNGISMKLPVSSWVEKINSDGESSDDNKQISGEAVVTVTFLL